MAFLHIDQDDGNLPAHKINLSAREMVIDVLATEAKVIADIKEILIHCNIKIPDTVNRFPNTPEQIVSAVFLEACMKEFFNRDKSLINLDSNICEAFEKYWHFPEQFADAIFKEPEPHQYLRIKEKYHEYSNLVNEFYDFFTLPLDKKIQLLHYDK